MEGMDYMVPMGDMKRASYCECMYNRDNSYFASKDLLRSEGGTIAFLGLKLR
jgi:hypothetical protein